LRALGCRSIDVTWLASMLRTRGAADIPWTTSWREQLANRDRDAILLGEDPQRVAASVV
jgi:hypothetical protein